jgi:hypothetical protein
MTSNFTDRAKEMREMLMKHQTSFVAKHFKISSERVRQIADREGEISLRKCRELLICLENKELEVLFEHVENLKSVYQLARDCGSFEELFSRSQGFHTKKALANFVNHWRSCAVDFPYFSGSVRSFDNLDPLEIKAKRLEKGKRIVKRFLDQRTAPKKLDERNKRIVEL